MTETIQHPSIGTVVGKAEDGTVQFLGVKYASLNDRFAEPQLLSHYHGDKVDATKIGPQVVSPPNGCDIEYRFLQHSLPHPRFEVSDLDGLHLNITVPSGANGLPVLVFIHGGGFASGSNAWPQYNHARLVKLSVSLGSPILTVGINYRVGIPGFLTSAELRAAGYKSNNGIRDQRVALKWVKRHIQGFGGDADNITLMGQSAGGVASMLNLQSKEPLFEQLIVMSGTPLTLQPLQRHISEMAYSLCVNALGIQSLSAEDRVKEIVHGPVSRLWEEITPDIPLRPVIDNDIIYRSPTYQDFAGEPIQVEAALASAQWCKRVLIGNCQSDASIYSYGWESRKAGIADAFHNSLTKSLSSSPETIRALEQAYDINSNTIDEVALRNIVKFASDIGFYAPVVAIGNGWPGEAYVYHFNQPNPWEGPWKGEASHIMDLVYLFQNFNEYLTQDQQASARQFAGHVIAFVNGKQPFPSRNSNVNGAMVYGYPAIGAAFVESTSPSDFGRRDTILQLALEVGLDALRDALGQFIACK